MVLIALWIKVAVYFPYLEYLQQTRIRCYHKKTEEKKRFYNGKGKKNEIRKKICDKI